MRLGHMLLFFIYASSFVVGISISKDIVYPEKVQHQTMNLTDVSNSIADAIGMNDFFDMVNEGM